MSPSTDTMTTPSARKRGALGNVVIKFHDKESGRLMMTTTFGVLRDSKYPANLMYASANHEISKLGENDEIPEEMSVRLPSADLLPFSLSALISGDPTVYIPGLDSEEERVSAENDVRCQCGNINVVVITGEKKPLDVELDRLAVIGADQLFGTCEMQTMFTRAYWPFATGLIYGVGPSCPLADKYLGGGQPLSQLSPGETEKISSHNCARGDILYRISKKLTDRLSRKVRIDPIATDKFFSVSIAEAVQTG